MKLEKYFSTLIVFFLCQGDDEEPGDYEVGPSFTKEFKLIGKDKKSEKFRVMQKPSLFNKNLKVSKFMSDVFVKQIQAVLSKWFDFNQIENANKETFSGKWNFPPNTSGVIPHSVDGVEQIFFPN